jgi:hypothetical protein
LYPGLTQGVYFYNNHPTRDFALATTARMAAVLFDGWLLSAAYRFTYYAPRSSTAEPWLQHDVYATAGYAVRRFGLSLHYAMLHGALSSPVSVTDATPSDYSETSHHLGVTARYSIFGDGLLAAAVSLYPTDTVVRSELSWWLPINHGLRVRPGAALQYSGGAVRPSGSLTLGYDHPRAGVYVGGKYGSELRPAQLVYEIIYNGPELIPYGLWAGATARPGAGFALALSYAYDRLVTTGQSATTESDVHYLTLSVSKEL